MDGDITSAATSDSLEAQPAMSEEKSVGSSHTRMLVAERKTSATSRWSTAVRAMTSSYIGGLLECRRKMNQSTR